MNKIDEILEAYKHFVWTDITDRGKQGLDKYEVKQAILADLLAMPVAQDEVSQKLTQSNQEWAKYAHIRNAIRQEWRKALTAYFEGEKYNCDCDFDVDPNDLTDDWHYLRTCYSCGKQWYALHCPHEKIQHPCPNCGIIPDRERYLRKD